MKIIMWALCLFFMFGCSPQKIDTTIVKINDVKQEEKINLDIDSRKNPHGMRILISGLIDKPVRIRIFDKDSLQHEKNIKAGRIDLKINIEWYANNGFIEYIPSSNAIQGELTIKYGFRYIEDAAKLPN